MVDPRVALDSVENKLQHRVTKAIIVDDATKVDARFTIRVLG